jgi:hypothetical protein
MKKSPLRMLAAVCITAAGLGFVAAVFSIGLSDQNAAERDFISYWAAGQQLMHGANPYDLDAVQALERAVGRKDSQLVLTMRNPPIAFFLAWPLGLVSPKTGLIVWLFVLLACLVLSVRLLWLLNGRSPSVYHLFCFLYAPVLSCMMAGQFGIFLLLGVVLFLYFQRSRPFFAGAALLLCALKPHLFLPFGLALILWTVSRRSYRVLAGFSAALLASCTLSCYLDPHAWSEYNQMMHAGGALGEKVPALSVYFRFLVDPNAVWLQFLPLGAACVWAIWYFWTRRELELAGSRPGGAARGRGLHALWLVHRRIDAASGGAGGTLPGGGIQALFSAALADCRSRTYRGDGWHADHYSVLRVDNARLADLVSLRHGKNRRALRSGAQRCGH